MRPSRVNNSLQFGENQWVISVINSDEGIEGKVFGHAVLLVEGLMKNFMGSSKTSLWVGQYDIRATAFIDVRVGESDTSTIKSSSINFLKNTQGVIDQIKVRESKSYTHPRGDKFYQSQSRSYLVLYGDAQNMINSIKEDKQRVMVEKPKPEVVAGGVCRII